VCIETEADLLSVRLDEIYSIDRVPLVGFLLCFDRSSCTGRLFYSVSTGKDAENFSAKSEFNLNIHSMSSSSSGIL